MSGAGTMINTSAPSGRLRMAVVPAPRPPLTIGVLREHGLAQPGQPGHIRAWKRANEEHLERGLHDLELCARGRGPRFLGALWAKVNRADGVDDLGLVSARVVTDVGVQFIVDAFQNLTELETMKYHGIGTGTTAESAAQTALVTEATTQYVTNNTRPAGSLAEGSATNIFETVATVTVKASIAVTEHGIFSQTAVPGGVLLDRSVFTVVNLSANEGITFQYDLTFPSGG